jgi:hypothetical protein
MSGCGGSCATDERTTLGGQPEPGGSQLLDWCGGSPHVGADRACGRHLSAASWQGMRVRAQPPPCPHTLLAAMGRLWGRCPHAPRTACARRRPPEYGASLHASQSSCAYRGAPVRQRLLRRVRRATPGAARAAGRPATRPAWPGRRSKRTRRPRAPAAAARPTPGLRAPRRPPPAPRRGHGIASGGGSTSHCCQLVDSRLSRARPSVRVCWPVCDEVRLPGSRARMREAPPTGQWAMAGEVSYPGQTLARAAWPRCRSAAISASGGAPAELPAQRPPPRACPPHLG